MICEQHKQLEKETIHTPQALDLPVGIPPLLSLYIYISGTCNLACRHCWIDPDLEDKNAKENYITPDHLNKPIKCAKSLGLKSVKLTGGEPLLHPQFRKIVELVADKKLSIIIETNGTLINRELAYFLKKNKMVKFISVSLDGIDSQTHEKLRGVKGCFDRTVKGLKYLVDAGFKPQIICSLHKGNIDQCEKLIKTAEIMGCGSIKFNRIQKIARGNRFFDQNGLEIEEILQQYKYIEKEIEPHSNIGIYYDIPIAFFSIKRLLKGSIGRCMILNILGILSNGDISICGIGRVVPDLIFGNIAVDSIREVWINSPGFRMVRELIPERLEGICADCIHSEKCLGACVANNFFRKGRLNAPYEFCEKAEKKGLFPLSRKKLP